MENQYKEKFLNAANKIKESYNCFTTTEDKEQPQPLEEEKIDEDKYATIELYGEKYSYNNKIVHNTITLFGEKEYIKEKIEEKNIYDFTQSAFNHKEAIDIINSMALTDSSAEEKAMIFNKKVYDTLIINDIALAYHGARKIFFQ